MALIRLACLVGALTLGAYSPYLPGDYDSLSVPLSVVAQVLAWTGLLFLPIGAIGWARRPWLRSAGGARARVIASVVATAVVSLVAWASSGPAFAFGTLTLAAATFAWLGPRLTPFEMAAAPPAAVLLQWLLAGPMVEFSRNRAIDNSASLIAGLEAHRAAHGRYPQSLGAASPDYKVSVRGIERFHFVPHGDTYNLYFEQPLPLVIAAGTREFVVYNPRGEHMMLSHAAWHLSRAPARLAEGQGWYAVHDGSRPHWKRFRFD